MKFKDLVTGNILETENEMVIRQFLTYHDRYKQIEEEKPAKAKKTAEQ